MRNGDGLRVVLWVAGCEHHCAGCQNPITWNHDDGIFFDEAAKKEIYEQLNEDYISGITFSGGDPLYQVEPCLELAKYIKTKKMNIWCYTGFTYEALMSMAKQNPKILEFLEIIDVLVDGQYVNSMHNPKLAWRGSENQRVIDVKKTLLSQDITVPVIYCPDYY